MSLSKKQIWFGSHLEVVDSIPWLYHCFQEQQFFANSYWHCESKRIVLSIHNGEHPSSGKGFLIQADMEGEAINAEIPKHSNAPLQ